MKSATMRIVLADDHAVVREGLRVLLESEPDFCVVGEAADGREAVELAGQTKPDVFVLDLRMPGLGGLEVARRIRELSPRTRMVVLSMYAAEAYVHQALKSGAAAYVVKDASATELVHAIRKVVAGQRYLSPPLTEQAIEQYGRRVSEAPLDSYETLTRREREVLHLAAEGLTSAAIGERLGISRRTVEVHRARVMNKMGFRSHTELVRYALTHGISPVTDAPPPEPVPDEPMDGHDE